jgi:PKD repeat protein
MRLKTLVTWIRALLLAIWHADCDRLYSDIYVKSKDVIMVRWLLVALSLFVLAVPCRVRAATASLVADQQLNVSPTSGDPSPDAVVDLQAFTCNCPANMGLIILNGARLGNGLASTYASMTYAEAQTRTYNGADGDSYGPDPGDLFYVRTGTAPNSKYFKLRIVANSGGTISLEYDWLGTGDLLPPDSAFTSATYDLWSNFTNTSTGAPSAYSWSFDDGQTSTQANPRHRFANAGTFHVCLTASNGGGADPTPACSNVIVSEVAGPFVPTNTGIDLDGDTVEDFSISSTGCAPIPNRFIPVNGARHAQIAMDYRLITVADVEGRTFTGSDACVGAFAADEYRDYLSGFLILTSRLNLYRIWIADSTVSGIRIEYSLLGDLFIFRDGFEISP